MIRCKPDVHRCHEAASQQPTARHAICNGRSCALCSRVPAPSGALQARRRTLTPVVLAGPLLCLMPLSPTNEFHGMKSARLSTLACSRRHSGGPVAAGQAGLAACGAAGPVPLPSLAVRLAMRAEIGQCSG